MMFADEILRAVIGKGWRWPLRFDPELGGFQTIDGEEGQRMLNQAIYLVLATRKGEVFMNPLFGTRIPDLLFDPNDSVLGGELRFEVEQAFKMWLPQLMLLDVQSYQDEADANLVRVVGQYAVRNTPVQGNFVVPFQTGAPTLG